jgi:hypothetical protein
MKKGKHYLPIEQELINTKYVNMHIVSSGLIPVLSALPPNFPRIILRVSPGGTAGIILLSRSFMGWQNEPPPDLSSHRCTERGRFMSKELRLLPVIFVGGASSLVGLLGLLGRPSVSNIRTVDIIHLIATGVSLGAFLVTLVLFFVFRYRSQD